MLSGMEIKNRLGKSIIIEPFDESKLNPNSYNITLSNKLKVYTGDVLDAKKDNIFKEITIPKSGYVLQPGELYIGSTNEYTETYDLIPAIDGRSSIGRLGISVHATAGFGDVGFKGTWTLEIFCIKPVRIYPDMEIGQLYYELIDGDPSIKYNGRYQGQKEATTSRYFKK